MPDFALEQALGGRVAGVDEAGRGPLAGPVVAAAVILDPASVPAGIDDSKRLGRAARTRLHLALRDVAAIGVGAASVALIDRLNIRQATLIAMGRAVAALHPPPDAVLVDGLDLPDCGLPGRAVVKGDSRSLSIAAASIVAKVTRDRIMAALHPRRPHYGWATNQGYGTPAHLAALARLGPCPHHRRSFAPVRESLSEESSLTI